MEGLLAGTPTAGPRARVSPLGRLVSVGPAAPSRVGPSGHRPRNHHGPRSPTTTSPRSHPGRRSSAARQRPRHHGHHEPHGTPESHRSRSPTPPKTPTVGANQVGGAIGPAITGTVRHPSGWLEGGPRHFRAQESHHAPESHQHRWPVTSRRGDQVGAVRPGVRWPVCLPGEISPAADPLVAQRGLPLSGSIGSATPAESRYRKPLKVTRRTGVLRGAETCRAEGANEDSVAPPNP